MKLKVFALFDSKAAYYGTPFFLQNKMVAMRSFSDLVKDPQSMVSKHPEDFNLYEIGEYDDSTGVMKSEPPLALGNATQFVTSDQPELPFVVGSKPNVVLPVVN